MPGSVVRHARSSSVPIDRLTPHRCPPRRLREHVDVAQDHRGLGQDRERVPRLGERRDQSARQPVAPLGGLVRIGVRAHRDVVAAPARRPKLGPQALDRVDLDDDPPLEVDAGIEVEVRVRRPREAVHARVRASAVGVDREPERHARACRHAADDAASAHVQVLDRGQVARPGWETVVEERSLRLVACQRPAECGGRRHAHDATRTYVRASSSTCAV